MGNPVCDPPGSNYNGSEAFDVVVTLTSGILTDFELTLVSVTQDNSGTGLFTLVLNNAGKPFSESFNWNEQYLWSRLSSAARARAILGPIDYNWPYTITFSELTLTIVAQFEYKNDAWQVSVISVTPTPGTVSPNIPGKSMVNYQEHGACGNSVSDATQKSVDTLDFAGAIKAVLGPVLSSIPATGQITSDISFQFEEGPAGLTFPTTGGVLAGVTGTATQTVRPTQGRTFRRSRRHRCPPTNCWPTTSPTTRSTR